MTDDREAQATPRTDAAAVHTINFFGGFATDVEYWVPADLARDLERALTAATARAEEAEKLRATTREALAFTSSDEENRLRTRLAALESALNTALGQLNNRAEPHLEPIKAGIRKAISALPDAGKEE